MTGAARFRRLRSAGLALALVAALLVAGCGKKGPPQAPLRIRPSAPRALQVRQRGETVWISMKEPASRTDGSDLLESPLIRLYLLPGGFGEAPSASGRTPSVRGAGGPTWIVARERWPQYRVGNRLEIPLSLESLGFGGSAAPGEKGRRIAFAAEVQEGKRKRSELAGPVHLTLCTAPRAPELLRAESTEEGIRLTWPPPPGGGETAHLYRGSGESAPGEQVHATVEAAGGAYVDRTVVTGVHYSYELRFAAGGAQALCESTAASAALRSVDTFPPSPPGGLAAAAEAHRIRLFWTPGDAADLAGYLVYRQSGDDAEFLKLTAAPITETTYADHDVTPGVRYTYTVTAVDGALPPNESGRSEPASEMIR